MRRLILTVVPKIYIIMVNVILPKETVAVSESPGSQIASGNVPE